MYFRPERGIFCEKEEFWNVTAAWHTGKELKSFPSILIKHQPPYSPELNPVEHFWEHLREKYTSNHFWNDMDELEDQLCSSLAECSRDKATIKSLSSFDWMVYN
ncbi:MAG: hypothetical protein A2X49_03995 [Lentisphaerae bacterium GWF2_52_8]|nr:MAG: hypothetical protein A2X49_03995 [Lentisphaerae bacterium GWF2_52_8]